MSLHLCSMKNGNGNGNGVPIMESVLRVRVPDALAKDFVAFVKELQDASPHLLITAADLLREGVIDLMAKHRRARKGRKVVA